MGSILFQLFSGWLVLRTIYDQGGAGTAVLKQSERTAILFQSSTSMTGVINFKYAFGTKNTAIIQLMGVHVIVSLLFVLTLSAYLVQQ